MRSNDQSPMQDYIRTLYAPESDLLREIREVLAERRLSIHVSPEEGKLLQMLVRLSGTKQIVEIGTLGGYSALWMAAALPEGGHLTTFERSANHAALARDFIARSPYKDRITLIEGDAHAALRSTPFAQGVDLVFIDAEKAGYPDYLDWAETLLKPGGLVVGDNTKLFGTVCEETPPAKTDEEMWNAMRAFNQRLADTSKYEALMLPTGEGMTVAIRKP